MPGAAKPRSFASRAQFRAWLGRHHASAAELNLRLFNVHARERGVTYREALDEALCFGWIACSAQGRPIAPLARKPADKKTKAVRSK